MKPLPSCKLLINLHLKVIGPLVSAPLRFLKSVLHDWEFVPDQQAQQLPGSRVQNVHRKFPHHQRTVTIALIPTLQNTKRMILLNASNLWGGYVYLRSLKMGRCKWKTLNFFRWVCTKTHDETFPWWTSHVKTVCCNLPGMAPTLALSILTWSWSDIRHRTEQAISRIGESSSSSDIPTGITENDKM